MEDGRDKLMADDSDTVSSVQDHSCCFHNETVRLENMNIPSLTCSALHGIYMIVGRIK